MELLIAYVAGASLNWVEIGILIGWLAVIVAHFVRRPSWIITAAAVVLVYLLGWAFGILVLALQ